MFMGISPESRSPFLKPFIFHLAKVCRVFSFCSKSISILLCLALCLNRLTSMDYIKRLPSGPVVQQPSSHAPLWWPGVHMFKSWAQTLHHSSSHAEAASHIAEPEGPTTRIYNYVLEGFGEKNKKKKKEKIANRCQLRCQS